jgi:hypothetical protein
MEFTLGLPARSTKVDGAKVNAMVGASKPTLAAIGTLGFGGTTSELDRVLCTSRMAQSGKQGYGRTAF